MTLTVSEMDRTFYAMAREHISEFLGRHVMVGRGIRGLEIGPVGGIPFVSMGGFRFQNWDTLDVLPGCTFQADITKGVPVAPSTYDIVVCAEVLEHTTQPFDALAEIRRLTKPGGLLLASAPMNFREHGPLPDCFRFTRHGWRVLLKDWDDVQLDVLMTPDRFLMPLHICVSARCNKAKNVDASTMTFPLETT